MRSVLPVLTRRNWSFGMEGPDSIVGFCVMVLTSDGLGVAPFDRHPGGTGELSALGLSAESWRHWLEALISAQRSLGSAIVDVHRPGPASSLEILSMRPLVEFMETPGMLCPGSTALKHRINMLWARFQSEWHERQQSFSPEQFTSDRPPDWLWRSLSRYQRHVPELTIYRVDYPVPSVMAVPPSACLVAREADRDAYGRQIVDGVRQLATLNGLAD